MSLRLYLIGIGVTSASALFVWLWILWTTDPVYATNLEFVLFYITLFVWLSGVMTLGGFYLRLIKSRNEFYYGNLLSSLRRALFFGIFATVSLALLGANLINLPEIFLLFCATLLFELYFTARK